MNICIFEDNKHLRESLQLLIDSTPEFQCKGAFPNCKNLIKNLSEIDCDICLMWIVGAGCGIDCTVPRSRFG